MPFQQSVKPYYQQLVFVFLAFAAMVAVSFWHVRGVVREQAEINGNVAMDSADATVRTLFAEVEIPLVNAAATIEELIAGGESQDVIASAVRAVSRGQHASGRRNSIFTDVYAYVRGELFTGEGGRADAFFFPPEQPWYAKALAAEGVHYSEPRAEFRSGQVLITASQKIFAADGEPCGVVAMDFDISAVSSFIRGLYSAGGGYAVLLNDAFRVLAHRNEAFQGRFFGDASPAYAFLAGKLSQGQSRLCGVTIRDYDGEESVAFFSRLPNGWYVGTVTPVALYDTKVRSMAALLAIMGAGLSAILCFLLVRLYAAKEEADTRSRAKTSFLAKISHEIRTPMNAILGMTEVILRDERTITRKTYESALVIRQAGQSLLAIINDILDLTKIESGKMELAVVPYPLAALLNDTVNIMGRRVAEKNLRFLIAIDSDIPATLIGDEARIRQVLLNVLTNAVKYTDTGHISFSLNMVKRSEDVVTLRFSIADTGRGIRQEDIGKLFGEFVRLDAAANRNVEGTGLGLAITKSLVTGMGGEVGVTSSYGRGSCFTVTLPQSYADAKPFARVKDAASHHVLLVGESDLYLSALSEMLNSLGVRNAVAKTALDVATIFATEKITTIFIEQCVFSAVQDFFAGCGAEIIILTEKAHGTDWGHRSLMLPCHVLSVANILNREAKESPSGEESGGGVRFRAPSARILVVDDIRTNLKIMESLLEPYDIEVDFCLGGAEAVILARDSKYDLVLMDHMMPGMDGVEAARRIKSLPGLSGLPVIAFTANAVTGMEEFFLENGLDGFLVKPVELPKLEELLIHWIPASKREKYIPPQPREKGLFTGRSLDGIDFAAGLRRFSGREESYVQVLQSFVTHTAPLLEKITSPGKESLRDFAISVHAIKSSSAGIGAEEAALAAESLEAAAKAGNFEKVAANTPAFIAKIRALLTGLAELLAGLKEPEEKAVRSAPDRVVLLRLLEACRDYDLDAMEECVRELERFEYEDAEIVAWLRAQVDTLEYGRLLETLESMLGNAKEGSDNG